MGSFESRGSMREGAPAIAISSDADPHHIARSIEAGFIEHLPKPMQPEGLKQSVRLRLRG